MKFWKAEAHQQDEIRLYGVVGYHVCLTHRRSSVQVRVQTLLPGWALRDRSGK